MPQVPQVEKKIFLDNTPQGSVYMIERRQLLPNGCQPSSLSITPIVIATVHEAMRQIATERSPKKARVISTLPQFRIDMERYGLNFSQLKASENRKREREEEKELEQIDDLRRRKRQEENRLRDSLKHRDISS